MSGVLPDGMRLASGGFGLCGRPELLIAAIRKSGTRDHTCKQGESKALQRCTLPLTGQGVVNRIITNLGVLDVVPGGLKIVELADSVTEAQLRAATEGNVCA